MVSWQCIMGVLWRSLLISLCPLLLSRICNRHKTIPFYHYVLYILKI